MQIRQALTGVAISVPITILGTLLGLPLMLAAPIPASFGPLGFLVAFAIIPIACNLFVWGAYMTKSSQATQVSLLVTGVVLSFIFAIMILAVLILGLMSAA